MNYRTIMSQDLKPKTRKEEAQSSPSFVKLAMKNMVRKGNQSLIHFGLTGIGCVGLIVLLAWLGRPNIPQ